MMEDLPTLGYPMKPTDICLRSEWRTENWRSSWMREPLPNEWFMEAWKASVGAIGERIEIHRAWQSRTGSVQVHNHRTREQENETKTKTEAKGCLSQN